MPLTKRRRTAGRKAFDGVIPKDRLAKEIRRILQERELTQNEAAYIVKDAPSQISLIVTGKTRGFSAERLLRTLTRLGRDIELVIRPHKGAGAGRIRLLIR